MRIRAQDPGADTARVFLNGVALVACLEADDVEGWCDVLRSEPGLLAADLLEATAGAPVVRLFGRVEIARPAPPE